MLSYILAYSRLKNRSTFDSSGLHRGEVGAGGGGGGGVLNLCPQYLTEGIINNNDNEEL